MLSTSILCPYNHQHGFDENRPCVSKDGKFYIDVEVDADGIEILSVTVDGEEIKDLLGVEQYRSIETELIERQQEEADYLVDDYETNGVKREDFC